jgi:hypothetical protein
MWYDFFLIYNIGTLRARLREVRPLPRAAPVRHCEPLAKQSRPAASLNCRGALILVCRGCGIENRDGRGVGGGGGVRGMPPRSLGGPPHPLR